MLMRNLLKLTCISLALCGELAMAQTNIRVASTARPGSILMNYVDEMVSKVNMNSNGAVKAERLFIQSEQEMTSQLVRGRIEMANVSYTGISALVPEAALLNMPFLWKSDEERDYVTDNHALPILKRTFEAKGLYIVGLVEIGWADVFCKTACLTPADVKGMKVRVAPAVTSKLFWSSVGANGVQMPVSELFPGLQSGLVDGGDLPFTYYVTTPAAQSAPHYVMTRHLHQAYTLVINKASWDKLSSDHQKLLLNARPDLARTRKEIAESEKPQMAAFRAKGGFVHELSAAQRDVWAKLVEPHQQKLVDEIGGQSGALWAAIQKGKQEFSARGGK